MRKPLAGLVVFLWLKTQFDLGPRCGPTFKAFLTYSKGPLLDTLNLSLTSLARALNPVPGNQSGMYCTIKVLVRRL